MRNYLDLMETILTKGRKKTDRTGVGTISLIGPQLRFDLSEGFPLLTTRKIFTRGIFEELIWFLSGSTDNNVLTAKSVNIWSQWAVRKEDLVRKLEPYERIRLGAETVKEPLDEFARKLNTIQNESGSEKASEYLDKLGVPREIPDLSCRVGDLGPIYGAQWRMWPSVRGPIDQISELMKNLRERPYSRRHIISAWNPNVLPDEKLSPQQNVLNGKQALAPCHTMFQFCVEPLTVQEILSSYREEYGCDPAGVILPVESEHDFREEMKKKHRPVDRLSCILYARSQDYPLGTAFNIPSYAALTMMIAKQLNMVPGDYIHDMGDTHIYLDQIDTVKEQLKRQPYKLPTLTVADNVSSLFDYTATDLSVSGYYSHPKLDYPSPAV